MSKEYLNKGLFQEHTLRPLKEDTCQGFKRRRKALKQGLSRNRYYPKSDNCKHFHFIETGQLFTDQSL